MRLPESYKRSGHFWVPGHDDRQVAGTLKVDDGGEIELETLGLFDESLDSFAQSLSDPEADNLGRIVGFVEKDGMVTLEGCFYRKKNHGFLGVSTSIVHVNHLLIGAHYEMDESIDFEKFRFSVEGLDEWVGITGINVEHASDWKSATISYTPQQPVLLATINDLAVEIRFSYTLPSIPAVKDARISQTAYIELTANESIPMGEFTRRAYEITNLLCFALDKTVSLRNVYGISDKVVADRGNDKPTPVPIQIIYRSIPFDEKPPKVSEHDAYFRYSNIRENADEIFQAWATANETIGPALGLYFSVKTGSHRYLEGRFLALAQALETFHRRTTSDRNMDRAEFRSICAKLLCLCPKSYRKWLRGRIIHGNEISLRQRITRIIEPFKEHFGNSKVRNRLVRDIVNTRNYFTHYDERLREHAIIGGDLYYLCLKMEALFQLHILRHIGFPRNQIDRILDGNYKLKSTLSET